MKALSPSFASSVADMVCAEQRAGTSGRTPTDLPGCSGPCSQGCGCLQWPASLSGKHIFS